MQKTFLSAVCFLALLAGCQLQAPYDPIVDQQTSQLQQDTDTLLAEIGRGIGTPGATYSFYEQSYDTLKAHIVALKTRAEIEPKNDQTVQEITLLQSNVDLLIQIHQNGISAYDLQPIQDSMDRIFRAILKLELAKKEFRNGQS
jgi:hypothetical protein